MTYVINPCGHPNCMRTDCEKCKFNKIQRISFDGYVCGVTRLPCCGCSLYCSNREKEEVSDG